MVLAYQHSRLNPWAGWVVKIDSHLWIFHNGLAIVDPFEKNGNLRNVSFDKNITNNQQWLELNATSWRGYVTNPLHEVGSTPSLTGRKQECCHDWKLHLKHCLSKHGEHELHYITLYCVRLDTCDQHSCVLFQKEITCKPAMDVYALALTLHFLHTSRHLMQSFGVEDLKNVVTVCCFHFNTHTLIIISIMYQVMKCRLYDCFCQTMCFYFCTTICFLCSW